MIYSRIPKQIWARNAFASFNLLMVSRCQKRHDEFLKDMFKNDPTRDKY